MSDITISSDRNDKVIGHTEKYPLTSVFELFESLLDICEGELGDMVCDLERFMRQQLHDPEFYEYYVSIIETDIPVKLPHNMTEENINRVREIVSDWYSRHDTVYIYQSHMGGFYSSLEAIDYADLYCETCGDADDYIGKANSRADAWKLLKVYTDIDDSGGYDLEYVLTFIDGLFVECST